MAWSFHKKLSRYSGGFKTCLIRQRVSKSGTNYSLSVSLTASLISLIFQQYSNGFNDELT